MILRGVSVRPASRTIIKAWFPSHRCSRSFHDSILSSILKQRLESYGELQAPEDNHELFEYTSGRWLYNESSRLAERRLVFNVEELKKAAAKSIGLSIEDVKSIQKLAEGGYNRVLEVSMKDGSSVLARLPYPKIVPRRWATASEVATMDFVRDHGIPVPRILGYSIKENPVGSEYILTEKIPGKPLEQAWYSLSEHHRLKVIHDIVEIESKLFNINLPANGSIYYVEDLDTSIPRASLPLLWSDFCVGPYSSENWWRGERTTLEVDKGPHQEILRVFQSGAEKELAWIHAFGKRRFPAQRQYREALEYKKQDPMEHAQLLRNYLDITPYLVPAQTNLHLPVLRHPNLQPSNIYVDENFTVTGLVDWQQCDILPTYIACAIPFLFQNYEDPVSQSLVQPKLVESIDSLGEEERSKAMERYRRQHIHFSYVAFTMEMNKRHFDALSTTTLIPRQIHYQSSRPWDGCSTSLQYHLVKANEYWPTVAVSSSDGTIPQCPVSVTKQEAERILALDETFREIDSSIDELRRAMGMGPDGEIEPDRYDFARDILDAFADEYFAEHVKNPEEAKTVKRHWPFDDHDEDE